ncbi:MAG: calcium-binding protein, partial [Alphaproteobacteria bacterium]|nr:calcium-binding protein [Alphaproteobacteria bacterium]
GSLHLTGWVSNNDGILVADTNNTIDHRIDISQTISEYYGGQVGSNGESGTKGKDANGKTFTNGFDALKSLDANKDGVFNSNDSAWANLRVWVDANHDGVVNAGELKTFADLGITAINLSHKIQSGEIRDGNEVQATGTFVMNGATREMLSANFLSNMAGSSFTNDNKNNGTVISTVAPLQIIDGADVNSTNAKLAASKTNPSTTSFQTNITTGTSLNANTLNVINIYGNAGDDILTAVSKGSTLDNTGSWLIGGGGSNTYNGGTGNDVFIITANDQSSNIHGGGGTDMVVVVGSGGVNLNLSQAQITIAEGGVGDDTIIGGGRSTVFVAGGAGDDTIIGSAANDVLNGDEGEDYVDGGYGNDLLHGGSGADALYGGVGDDIVYSGTGDDYLNGGDGDDVLFGETGDDYIDGGDGVDIASFSGSFADYNIVTTANGIFVTDTISGRDGTDFLVNVEKIDFADIKAVDFKNSNAMLAKDVLTSDKTGATFSRTAQSFVISSAQLLANDLTWNVAGKLTIDAISNVVGGTAVLNTTTGDITFTPDATYTGFMGFQYSTIDTVYDASGRVVSTNQTKVNQIGADGKPVLNHAGKAISVPMQAKVFLQTPDMPTDPLLTSEWYLSSSNILPVWKDYTGKAIKIGQFEPGGRFAVTPEVMNYRH